jgi:hypothetical protein
LKVRARLYLILTKSRKTERILKEETVYTISVGKVPLANLRLTDARQIIQVSEVKILNMFAHAHDKF